MTVCREILGNPIYFHTASTISTGILSLKTVTVKSSAILRLISWVWVLKLKIGQNGPQRKLWWQYFSASASDATEIWNVLTAPPAPVLKVLVVFKLDTYVAFYSFSSFQRRWNQRNFLLYIIDREWNFWKRLRYENSRHHATTVSFPFLETHLRFPKKEYGIFYITKVIMSEKLLGPKL